MGKKNNKNVYVEELMDASEMEQKSLKTVSLHLPNGIKKRRKVEQNKVFFKYFLLYSATHSRKSAKSMALAAARQCFDKAYWIS